MEDSWSWSFLEPWCQHVVWQLEYVTGLMEDAPGQRYRGLQAQLPSLECADNYPGLREALGLLAAVAHVDNAAWKRLLLDYVRLKVDNQEELFEGKFLPRFQLAMIGDGPDCDGELLTGLEEFCGVKQHTTHSAAYTEALARIAAIAGGNTCAESTEIEVPVTIQLGPWLATNSDGTLKYLRAVQQKVRDIRTQWLGYIDKTPIGLSVTFVLETLLVDLRDAEISVELAEVVNSLASDGVQFSGLALRQELHRSLTPNGNQGAARKVVGQLVWGLFGGTKRIEAIAGEEWGGVDFEATTMTGPLASMYGHANQLALSSVHFDCEAMQNWVFERVCSAVAVSQTTTHLSLTLELNDGDSDDDDDGDWALCRWRWEWITFACFSEKARLHSRLESLTLRNTVMTGEAVEAMAAVLASDGPEESLLDCVCYPFDGSTDICIKASSSIRLRPMHADESYSDTFSVDNELSGVRLVGAVHESGWVDVLIPGYGLCQVQQGHLVHREVTLPSNGLAGVTSLTIEFGEDPDPDVLQALLTLIGASLSHLKLGFEDFDTHDLEGIVASCPNLVELAVCTYNIEVRFCLRDSNYRDLILDSAAHVLFRDVEGIVEALCDSESPFAKCVRRLRVRLDHRGVYFYEDCYNALTRMLETNRTLVYLDVVAQRPHMTFFNDIKAHHLEALPVVESALSLGCKAAFLSVMGRKTEGNKKRKNQAPLRLLDEYVLVNIFEYAAVQVTRRVYFREYDFFKTGRNYMPI